jgi:hypothetical protein
MPDNKKTTQPPVNLTEPKDAIQPNQELPQDSIMHLPTGYQKIHLRPLVPKPIADTHLVRNRIFQSSDTPLGCGKPISKIIEVSELAESTSEN